MVACLIVDELRIQLVTFLPSNNTAPFTATFAIANMKQQLRIEQVTNCEAARRTSAITHREGNRQPGPSARCRCRVHRLSTTRVR